MATLHPVSCPASESARCGARCGGTLRCRQQRRSARAGDGNPLSFLHVSRAEIDLPPGDRPLRRRGLRASGDEFQPARRTRRWCSKTEPSVYFYRLRMGVARAARAGRLLFPRRIRRRRHQEARADPSRQGRRSDAPHAGAGAQTGPGVPDLPRVADVDAIAARVTAGAAAVRFRGARRRAPHLWRVAGRDRDALVAAFGRFRRSTSPTVITAPPARHGRGTRCATAGSRARAWRWRRLQHVPGRGVSARSGADPPLQPHRQGSGGRIAGRSFSTAVATLFDVAPGARVPGRPRRYRDVLRAAAGARFGRARRPDPGDPIGSLDVSVLQDQLLDADPGDRRRPHRQTDRFRRRRPRHGRARAAGRSRDGGGGVFAVSGQRRRPHGCLRRRRDHAAEMHLVRAQAARRPADHII